MKHIKLFKTEAEYETGVTALPCVSYVESTEEVHFDEKHAVDRIYNAPLMNMMYGLGLAENQDYMTYEEAARVPSLNGKDFATYEVISAWELKYFTGLVECPLFTGDGTYSLQELYIPDHLATIGSGGLRVLNLNKLHLPEALIEIPGYGIGESNKQDSILYIGANIASEAPGSTHANGWGTIICMSPAFTWNRVIGGFAPTIYVKDEYVNDYKAVAPWDTWGTVKPLSEYTGDTNY